MGDLVVEKSMEKRELQWVHPKFFESVRSEIREPIKKCEILATLSRLNILYAIAQAGSGHIGSSFSAIDIMTWLYEVEMKEEDLFFSSKGHDSPALYATLFSHQLLSFDQLSKLRRLGGLPGHPDRRTKGIHFNTGSLGMGISKAKGYLKARAIQNKAGRVFVMTGDGELQEGQIWESLISVEPKVAESLFILVDRNQFQSDFRVSATSDLGDLEAKFKAFGSEVQTVDGHDFFKINEAIQTLSLSKKAKVLICNTVKGKGVSFLESTHFGSERYRYHSGALSASDYTCASEELTKRISKFSISVLPSSFTVDEKKRLSQSGQREHRLVGAYSLELARAMEKHNEIVCLDADLAFDMGVLEIQRRFSDRYLECGIAEMDMVSQAGGMAVAGLLPICHSFACFLTQRPNEQIYNNLSEGTKVIYTAGLSGLIPAAPGHSHQSVRDLALMGSMPNMALLEPACEEDVGILLDWAIQVHDGPSYLRLCSFPTWIADVTSADPNPGCGRVWRKGEDGTLFCSGPTLLSEALKAADALSKIGIHLSVCSLAWVNKIDESWIAAISNSSPINIILENHHRLGGLNSYLLPHLATERTKILSVEGVPECGNSEEILDFHGLNASAIARSVLEFKNRG